MKLQPSSDRSAGAGFTLIELVIVITILGILAAIALPRFVSTQTDARIAKLNGLRGAVGAAATIDHSAYLTRSGVADVTACPGGGTATNLVNGDVCTEGGLINLANGYPASSAFGTAGIISAASLSTSVFAPLLVDLNIEGIGAVIAAPITTISVIGGSGTIGASGAQTNATCSFTYTAAAAVGSSPAISGVATAGC